MREPSPETPSVARSNGQIPGASSTSERPQPGSPAGTGVSARAVFVALVLLLGLLPLAFMVEQATNVSRGFSERVPPIAALGLAFLLTAINQAWARRRRWRGMGRQEVLVVYILLTIGGPLVSLGVMLWFLSCSVGQQYYVRTMPQWQTAFFRYIPPWFCPDDWPAVEGFFQGGASRGDGPSPEPAGAAP